MKFKCLGTGSSGNCYILDNGEETLILDCGVNIRDIKIGLDFRVDNVAGCLVTHRHSDHSRALRKIKKIGFRVFTPYDSEEKSDHIIIKRSFGSYKVYAFQVPHNNTENYGFLIESKGERLLYITDFEYCPFSFKKQKVNHFIVECNYQDELVDEDRPNFVHKILGHCGLSTLKDFLLANKTDEMKSVILVHLGEETTNPKQIVDSITKVANNGNFVECAYKGMECEL